MFGDYFVQHLKTLPPRSLPRLNLFINFLNRKYTDSLNRASYLNPNGYGSRLLVSILKLSDLSVVLDSNKSPSDIIDYLLWILKDLEKPLDPRVGKHTTSKLFINSKTPCFELMTPSRTRLGISSIPYDKPYDDPLWKEIKPFRLYDISNFDLRFQLHTDYLQFTKRGPVFALYTLDILSFVLKFKAYYHSLRNVINLDECILEFIHQEMVVPALLYDLNALWLRNIYKQQFLSASPLESHSSTIWDLVTIDTIGSDFTGAMVDINHLKEDLKKNTISHNQALSSLVIGLDFKSFTEFYKEIYNKATLPEEQPYAWIYILKNLNYWEFILATASFNPYNPEVITLRNNALRDIRFWLNQKPWQNIHGSIVFKILVRSKLEGLFTYLKSFP